MATKPVTLPRWADVGGSITDPPNAKKDVGWLVSEKPPAQYMNWWKNLVYKWTQYLDDLEAQVLTWAARHTFNKGADFKSIGTSSPCVSAAATAASNSDGVSGVGDGTGVGVRGLGGVNSPGVRAETQSASTGAGVEAQVKTSNTSDAPLIHALDVAGRRGLNVGRDGYQLDGHLRRFGADWRMAATVADGADPKNFGWTAGTVGVLGSNIVDPPNATDLMDCLHYKQDIGNVNSGALKYYSEPFVYVSAGDRVLVFEAVVTFPTGVGSDSTFYIGLTDNNDFSTPSANGAWFEAPTGAVSWKCRSRASNADAAGSPFTTATAVGTNVLTRLRIVIDARNTVVRFYINGVLVHTSGVIVPQGNLFMAAQTKRTVAGAAFKVRVSNMVSVWNLLQTTDPC